MASATPPALTGDHCLNSGMVAYLPLLLLLLSILTGLGIAVNTSILAGNTSLLAGNTSIHAGNTSILAGTATVSLLHSVLATVGALLQHGLAHRVPTAVVASAAAPELLLGWCRPGQDTGPHTSILLLLLPLP